MLKITIKYNRFSLSGEELVDMEKISISDPDMNGSSICTDVVTLFRRNLLGMGYADKSIQDAFLNIAAEIGPIEEE